jgi:ABC-type multidrug transport system ATPase subunit
MSDAIATSGLGKRFGRTRAVCDLTLAVPEGSIFAFLGPNGAGKTTTIKMLMNLIRPTTGRATVLGVAARRLGPRELAQIGYVSENQTLPDWMTVDAFLGYCRSLYPTWDDAFCTRLRAQFELPPRARLRDLSRGMKMKAVLVSSIVYRPRLLVLDEPFTGLDVLVRDELIRGVLELSEQERWTIFVSSHDIDEVERLADRVGVLIGGRLALAEPVTTLQARFRRAEVTLAPESVLPDPLPASWLGVERAGRRLTFVESAYREGALEQVFGSAGHPLVTPMSLREIFVAVAKGDRVDGRVAA